MNFVSSPFHVDSLRQLPSSQLESDAISNLPYFIMHVEPNEKVDIRTFLRCSLKKVCACEGPEILEQCLDAVLPICNSPETKAFMEDYCKQASDEGRYELKINAFKNVCQERTSRPLPKLSFMLLRC